MADSSDKCNRGLVKEYLMWRLKIKGLAGAMVEPLHGRVNAVTRL